MIDSELIQSLAEESAASWVPEPGQSYSGKSWFTFTELIDLGHDYWDARLIEALSPSTVLALATKLMESQQLVEKAEAKLAKVDELLRRKVDLFDLGCHDMSGVVVVYADDLAAVLEDEVAS